MDKPRVLHPKRLCQSLADVEAQDRRPLSIQIRRNPDHLVRKGDLGTQPKSFVRGKKLKCSFQGITTISVPFPFHRQVRPMSNPPEAGTPISFVVGLKKDRRVLTPLKLY